MSRGAGETSRSIKRTEQCHERVHSTAVEALQSQGKAKSTPLTDAQKAAAKQRAEEAGRPYPNLVDNMWASRQPK
ncbi:hypothetical protein [Xanthomonas euvesicatoria]|uniref:hypothetical protein n=1 Tax=Xanthomonas euvesicatoria TaxID=456327 RepID=UPI001C43D321|nr:hypothetical protein [Xanthomonas euvesicatoria]MBV6798367.1 hypothetical protein [Xanthomonas campestris pv. obscurae]